MTRLPTLRRLRLALGTAFYLLFDLQSTWGLTKSQIVMGISERFGLKDYLEICTQSTGYHFSDVHLPDLRRRRLMYNCPAYYNDDDEITYRFEGFDVSGVVEQILADGRPDLILLDGWHTAEHAYRDMRLAYGLLNPGGALIVHDIFPADRESANPQWKRGPWSGVTYKEFIDFVLTEPDLDYCTVDTDEGCGIIAKNRKIPRIWKHDLEENVRSKWLEFNVADDSAWDYYSRHRFNLARRITRSDFRKRFSII